MAATARGAFPYPEGAENWKQIRSALQAISDRVAAIAALFVESTAANRPTVGVYGRFHRATDTGALNLDTGTSWETLAFRSDKKTIRSERTFTISGDVLVAVGDTSYIPGFFIAAPAGQTVKVVAARHKLNSGTSATVSLQANGVGLAGFSAVSVIPTATTTDPADVTLADGDFVSLVVSAGAGAPKNMSFTVWLESTV